MFMNLRGWLGSLAAVAFTVGTLVPLSAEEPKVGEKKARAQEEVKVEVATNFRSSEIVGMEVRDRAGKSLGKIEDLVVELNSGDIRYAALSFGGFAGFGDKLFAVPWQSMTFKFGEDDRYFIFDTTQQQLERSPGFDQNNWPDVADPAWAASIDKHYKIDRTKNARTAADRASSDRNRESPPDKPTIEKPTNAPVVYDAVFRVSTLKGMKVRNERAENLGTLDELVFDIKKGSAKYAALSFGGFAGFGNKLFAIPMSSLTLKHAADETFFVFNVSPERLKDAPGFDKDHWPDTADPKWAADIDKFYGEERKAERPTTKKVE